MTQFQIAVFDTLNTIVDIPENMPVGSSVIMVSASDADSGILL